MKNQQITAKELERLFDQFMADTLTMQPGYDYWEEFSARINEFLCSKFPGPYDGWGM